MIRIETDQTEDHLTLRVAGRLCGANVEALEDCWKLACSRFGPGKHDKSKQCVDLRDVTSIDKIGWRLLRLMHRQGVVVCGNVLACQTIQDKLKDKEESYS